MPISPSGPGESSRNGLQGVSFDSHHIIQETTSSPRIQRSLVNDARQISPRKTKRWSNASGSNRPNMHSPSSRTTTASSSKARQSHEHGDVRTLPPWIDSFERNEDELIPTQVPDLLIATPPQAHAAQHHYGPVKPERRKSQDGYIDSEDDEDSEPSTKVPERGFFGGSKEPDKGRKWDHAREGEPVIVQTRLPKISSPWRTFVKSSMYGPALVEDGKIVDSSVLDEQTPGYVRPWRGDVEGDDLEKALGLRPSKKRRRIWYQRVQHLILMHPLVPLFFRLIVLSTSTIALGLSGSIYQLSRDSSFPQNPSTIMAIIVDVVAIPYIGYITWDEYTGKPLGLRSPKAKIRLVLLDLFFIVFESANLSLAFAALTDANGSCVGGDNGIDFAICSRIQTLSCFLFVALVAWILTFSVSILRLVERVGGRDEKER